MSDVADMLGIQSNKPAAPLNAAEEAVRFLQEANKAKIESKGKPIKKPKGMKREVYDLLGKDGIVPALQSNPVGPVFKNKRAVAARGRWVYAPIESSARGDNQLTFFHWVKADINYPDYPYAKFNVHLDPIVFTEEEYTAHLRDDSWSKRDTEVLLNVCHHYDLRWPIIFDRIQLSSKKTSEEIQARYFSIVNKVQSIREQQASHGIPSFQEKKPVIDYDLEKETKRRLQQDLLFKRLVCT
jgi:DNA methyltransferase 1-associated protein 1